MISLRKAGPALIAGLLLLVLLANSVKYSPPQSGRESWADSLLNKMSLREQAGQLLSIAVYSNKDLKHEKLIDSLVTWWKPGGIIVFQGTPAKSSALVARWQAMSKVPMLVSMDAEWGPSMRLDSLPVFPRQMTLGSIRHDSLIRLMGQEIGRQLKILGVHLSYSPVVDVNNNPANPVINSRSFGQSPASVGIKSSAYMQGLHDAGILACAKHFPGHGDTEKDSHVTLPIVNASRTSLDSIHLPPFRELIGSGVDFVMTAHINIPLLDQRPNRPATLSENINRKLLREELGFRGVVVTDALNMKGVADYLSGAELIVEALKAGTDVLLMPNDAGLAVNAILDAVNAGTLDSAAISRSCRRVLLAKYDAGLHKEARYKANPNAAKEINSQYASTLIRQLYQSAIVAVKNDSSIMPMQHGPKTAVVNIGGRNQAAFNRKLSLFLQHERIDLMANPGSEGSAFLARLDSFDRVIINLNASSINASRNYGITPEALKLIGTISSRKSVILIIAGNPYLLNSIPAIEKIKVILVSHEDRPEAQEASALALCGAIPVDGKLPVSCGTFKEGHGLLLPVKGLGFVSPLNPGIAPVWAARIDSIVMQGIDQDAFPGCQVLIARNGSIIYHKSFGTLNDDSSEAVDELSLYDIASVTKVAASALAIMKLYEDGKIDIDQTLGFYLPELKGSNKEKLLIRDVLAHQARLKAWIPFYKETIPVEGNPLYSSQPDSLHSIQVSHNLYLRNDWPDTLYRRLIDSELESTKKYLYSDLGYYFLQRIVAKVSGMNLDAYVSKYFYEPLGLASLGFFPLQRFPIERVAPTEYDVSFRGCLIRGYVHDQGAAMLGGKAGHAGLFSNSFDLAIIMQMLLDGGVYKEKRYLNESTIREFTRQQFPIEGNRRALIFDRPNPSGGGQVADEASQRSYGHSGFTGTFVWADPANKMVYIFVSNRVYPNAGNQTINRLDTRRNIQSMAYKAFASAK
jgi:beta-N-acetylhexosaminidase